MSTDDKTDQKPSESTEQPAVAEPMKGQTMNVKPIAGQGQPPGTVGQPLSLFQVEVTLDDGTPISSLPTEWIIHTGKGNLDGLPLTGSRGESAAEFTPSEAGPYLIACRVGGTTGGPIVRFEGQVTETQPSAAIPPPTVRPLPSLPLQSDELKAISPGRILTIIVVSIVTALIVALFLSAPILTKLRPSNQTSLPVVAPAAKTPAPAVEKKTVTSAAKKATTIPAVETKTTVQTIETVRVDCNKATLIEKGGHLSLVCTIIE